MLGFGKKEKKPDLMKSIDASLPQPVVIHGVTIQEQPTEVYLETVRRMGRMLVEILDAAFPTQKPREIFLEFMTTTPDGFRDMVGRLLTIVPDKTMEVLASIMGVEPGVLRKLPPLKLATVVKEFWKMNDLSQVFQMVREALAPALRTMKQNGGSSV